MLTKKKKKQNKKQAFWASTKSLTDKIYVALQALKRYHQTLGRISFSSWNQMHFSSLVPFLKKKETPYVYENGSQSEVSLQLRWDEGAFTFPWSLIFSSPWCRIWNNHSACGSNQTFKRLREHPCSYKEKKKQEITWLINPKSTLISIKLI